LAFLSPQFEKWMAQAPKTYRVTQKNGTVEKSKHLKHFYGDSTLFTVPRIHES
jgi:hypothetical protein